MSSPPPEKTTKTCPACAEEVKPAAAICRFCGHDFAGRHNAGHRRFVAQLAVVAFGVALLGILATVAIGQARDRGDAREARERASATAIRARQQAQDLKRKVETTITAHYKDKFARYAAVNAEFSDSPTVEEAMADHRDKVSCIRESSASNRFSCVHTSLSRQLDFDSGTERWRASSSQAVNAVVDPSSGEVQFDDVD